MLSGPTADVDERPQAWQRELAGALSGLGELLTYVGLSRGRLAEVPQLAEQAAAEFPVRVPRTFADRIRKGDPSDPLLLQVLATGLETDAEPGFTDDPLREIEASPIPGLLAKYTGRVLVIATSACAVHCRYCFRRHFPYHDMLLTERHAEEVAAYVQNHPSVHEVILSGGDPLSLSDSKLRSLVRCFASITHLRRLRIHSRLPIVIPARVTDELIALLADLQLQPVIVLHCNHPNELDGTVRQAVLKFRSSGILLLNQSVLLRGVNDSVETLAALSERLVSFGVMPYYLHTLDRVRGASHFDIPRSRALSILESMSATLPGYLVPRFVTEEPDRPAKTPLVSDTVLVAF